MQFDSVKKARGGRATAGGDASPQEAVGHLHRRLWHTHTKPMCDTHTKPMCDTHTKPMCGTRTKPMCGTHTKNSRPAAADC